MNAFPVLSASSIASSGLPATATRRMTGISESSTRFAVTTDVAPMADTAPSSSPNSSRRKSATPSDSMMNGYVFAFRMIVFRSGGWENGTSCGCCSSSAPGPSPVSVSVSSSAAGPPA